MYVRDLEQGKSLGSLLHNYLKHTHTHTHSDLKVIVLGAASVGKTCLLQRYLTGEFADTISVSGKIMCNNNVHLDVA